LGYLNQFLAAKHKKSRVLFGLSPKPLVVMAEIRDQGAKGNQREPNNGVVIALDALDKRTAQAIDGECPGNHERFSSFDVGVYL
jgi:hypothetical protein